MKSEGVKGERMTDEGGQGKREWEERMKDEGRKGEREWFEEV